MIYSRGLDISRDSFVPGFWNKSFFKGLSKNENQPGDIFYYDRHDLHLRKIKFNEFIDDSHWEQVRQNNASILIDYSDDFFCVLDIEHICSVIKEKAIPQNRVYMLVMDPLWHKFARKHFDRHKLHQVHVSELPWLLYQAVAKYPTRPSELATKRRRFSLLSRNYRDWRLQLILNMREEGFDFDQDTVYSFHNIEPYQRITYNLNDIQADCERLGFDWSRHKAWAKGIPYDIGSSRNKFFNGTYAVIANSDIHILIESHWDPYQMPDNKMHYGMIYGPTDWAPSFLTEKFYKAILCKVPFVIASTPYFLKDIKSLGYKTFSTMIGEHYDEIPNDSTRSRILAKELARLQGLSKENFDRKRRLLVEPINHNKRTLMEYYRRSILMDDFLFLRKYTRSGAFPETAFRMEFSEPS